MLLDTLKEINEMDSYSKSKLASRLDTSQEVMDHLLMKLEDMGYIKEENINGGKCSSCPSYNKGCLGVLSGKPINALTITDKGKKLLGTST